MITPEQRRLRMNGLGGSDAITVWGENKYKTIDDLLFEKVNEIEDEEETIAKIHGNLWEPQLIKFYEKKHNVKLIVNNSTIKHKLYPQLLAHIDGLLLNAHLPPKIIECKTTLNYGVAKSYGEENTDQVPRNVFLQCLHYMAVLNINRVDVIALLLNKVKYFTIKRDKNIEDKHITKCLAFLERLNLEKIKNEKHQKDV